jgi:hypothetical protein
MGHDDPTVPSDAAQQAEASVPGSRVAVVAAIAPLGGFLFGFDSAAMNGAVGAIESHFDAADPSRHAQSLADSRRHFRP